MVVDDTPANLDLLDRMLRTAGFCVLAFPRGRMALEAAADTPPDLALLDVLMPEMDGFEVCRRMKGTPRLADIPVIFISALGETDDKLRAFAAGGADYVTKPFQEEEILARVGAHLEIAALQRSLREHNENLERLVAERTRELAEVRLQTMESVAERIKAARWGKERSLGLRAGAYAELEPLSSAIEELAESAYSREENRIRYVTDLVRMEEETRRRLARELHDGPLQSSMAALKRIQMAGEISAESGPALREHLEAAEEIMRNATDELRSYCEELSPSWIKLGLVSAMDENADRLSRAHEGVSLELGIDETLDALPEEYVLALVRIFQEAVSNSVRHGGVRSVKATVREEGTFVRFSIRDDGTGFDSKTNAGTEFELLRTTGRRGLANINERARLLHGTLCLESRPGDGCRIEVLFPAPSGPTTP
jgi:signal transduction histidine kinase